MVAKFKVKKSGEIDDVKITESPYGDYVNRKLKEAIMRMPRWTPATKSNGEVKKSYVELPIRISCKTKMDGWYWKLSCDYYNLDF